MNLYDVGVNRDADLSRFAVAIKRLLITAADRTVNVYWSGGHCMMDFGSVSIIGLPGGSVVAPDEVDDDPAIPGAMRLVFQMEREAVRVFFREDDQRCVVRACNRERRGTKAIVARSIAFAAQEAARIVADFLNGETVGMEVA